VIILTWLADNIKSTFVENILTPDNTYGVYKIEQQGADSDSKIYQEITYKDTSTYTIQTILKPAPNTKPAIGFGDTIGDNLIYYDESTKEAIKGNLFSKCGVTNLNNGWINLWGIISGANIKTIPNGTNFSIFPNTLSGASYCYVYNTQIEERSFPTSIIDGERERSSVTYPNPISGMSEFTIAFWANVIALSADGSNTIFSINRYAELGTQTQEVIIDIQSNNNIRMAMYNDSLALSSLTGPQITLNKWTHYALVRERNRLIGYIDGVKIGEITASTYSMAGGVMRLGNRDAATPGHIGRLLIDELRIDKVPRSEEEIHHWFSSENPFYPRGAERIAL
jgi:hypothetical protein